ncbi:RING-H2 finger protein ATL58-like isoform X1 [Carex littledalei]|uniref:RING-type E3 ubiquitin transferase n=1 Tax=Carex littledalei TaxID=544730 RepID=A0A833RA82_9POAL|nr:RING-H2 finger protein ATL58-like isoform X1 [Carex littledalei]
MSCSSSNPPPYCSAASTELKLYQAFVFSVPVFFTFILLLLFYLFYLKRRRANWQSIRMRTNHLARGDGSRPSDMGLKKEVREMLPVVVFKESFLIRETQCSVCLGEYQSDEKLQRIPPCGHTFHVDCIDHWLSTNSTCPLCRVSLLPTPTKPAPSDIEAQGNTTQEEEGHFVEQIASGNDGSAGEESRMEESATECEAGKQQGEASVRVDLEAQ